MKNLNGDLNHWDCLFIFLIKPSIRTYRGKSIGLQIIVTELDHHINSLVLQ